MKLLAHISDDKTRTQTIEEHLTSTAALAGTFAAAFGAQAEASVLPFHRHAQSRNDLLCVILLSTELQ